MKNKNGFTLIEILVVIIIISILAGIVGVAVFRHPAEARVTAAKTQIKILKEALQLYKMEQNRYPTQQQGLEALCKKPTTPPIPERYPEEGYLASQNLPLDPWGNPYIYLSPGRKNESYEIITYGSDGTPDGEGDAADISSSDL
jgi:general secretion pathway protein G